MGSLYWLGCVKTSSLHSLHGQICSLNPLTPIQTLVTPISQNTALSMTTGDHNPSPLCVLALICRAKGLLRAQVKLERMRTNQELADALAYSNRGSCLHPRKANWGELVTFLLGTQFFN